MDSLGRIIANYFALQCGDIGCSLTDDSLCMKNCFVKSMIDRLHRLRRIFLNPGFDSFSFSFSIFLVMGFFAHRPLLKKLKIGNNELYNIFRCQIVVIVVCSFSSLLTSKFLKFI